MSKLKIFSICFGTAILITILEFLFGKSFQYHDRNVLIVLLLINNFFVVTGIFRVLSFVHYYYQSKHIQNNPDIQIQRAILKPPYKGNFFIFKKLFTPDGKPDGFLIDVNGLRLYAKSLIDIQLIYNISIRNVYNYIFTASSIVVDIGANVGYSALWFAKDSKVKKVFGFEPVTPNYERALRSLELNPELKVKIELRNTGLSDKDTKISILYNKEHHTISSVLFAKSNVIESKNTMSHENIELTDACKAINEIIDYKQEQNCSSLVLKIDCEGSEFQIFNSFDSRIWNSVDVILMEVHGNDFLNLQDLLEEKGFSVFSINHQKHELFDHLCDVYAIKNCIKE